MLKSKEKKLDSFVLYRYMAKEYCEKMVNDGEIRISNSSYYKDGAGITEGLQDDEHNKSVVMRASNVRMINHDPMDPRVDSEIVKLNTTGDQYKVATTLNDPYWMLCLSFDLRRDLFDVFDSDAAVIIRHPEKLFQKFHENSAILLPSPESVMEIRCQPVQYLSRLTGYGKSVFKISPCFTKPARYTQQKEYRIVWYPCYSCESHEYLHLGSLIDIAEVVLKDDLESGIVEERIIDEGSFHKLADEAIKNNF